MSLPAEPQRKTESQGTSRDDVLYGNPHVMILDDNQWQHVQRWYRMSPRELQVAKLVCEGFVNGDIARRLGLKPGTVKTHLRSIFGKTRARNKISMLLRFMAVVSEDSGPRVQSQDGEKMLRGFVQF